MRLQGSSNRSTLILVLVIAAVVLLAILGYINFLAPR